MARLVVFNAGTVRKAVSGKLSIAQKTLTGVQEYVKRWPGEVVFLTHEEPAESEQHSAAILGASWCSPESLEATYVGVADPFDWVRKLSPSDVVLALLKDTHAPLVATRAKVVWTGELSLETRIRQSLVSGPPLADRARIVAGAVRQERLLRNLVRQAGGLQANGYPAWNAYASLSRNPLLFFDTRLWEHQVAASQPRALGKGPLRLAFSGRHTLGKGPQYAVQLAKSLTAQGIACTLDIFGRGELTDQLRAYAGPETTFRGDVDFDGEWVPFVRDNVDLMVLPHRQGDPSGTYLEAAGLGVPTLGFDNEAFKALVQHSALGWAVRNGDGQAMLNQALRLLEDSQEITQRSLNGVSFMQEHHAEHEFERRVEHLQSVAQQ